MASGTTECTSCDREFTTTFTTDTEEIEGYTRSEDFPDEEECDFCQGEETCSEDKCQEQATVLDTDPGVVYCEKHWRQCCEENGDTVEECEEYALRLEERLHAKPKYLTTDDLKDDDQYEGDGRHFYMSFTLEPVSNLVVHDINGSHVDAKPDDYKYRSESFVIRLRWDEEGDKKRESIVSHLNSKGLVKIKPGELGRCSGLYQLRGYLQHRIEWTDRDLRIKTSALEELACRSERHGYSVLPEGILGDASTFEDEKKMKYLPDPPYKDPEIPMKHADDCPCALCKHWGEWPPQELGGSCFGLDYILTRDEGDERVVTHTGTVGDDRWKSLKEATKASLVSQLEKAAARKYDAEILTY